LHRGLAFLTCQWKECSFFQNKYYRDKTNLFRPLAKVKFYSCLLLLATMRRNLEKQNRCKNSNSSESKLVQFGTNQTMQRVTFEEERKIFSHMSVKLLRGSEWGGPRVGCRLKFPYFVGCRLKISTFVGCR